MNRLAILSAAFIFAASAVAAGRIEDSIVSQLRAQGFSRIEISRTLLGRSRIVARSPKLDREIIVNPATGEILRDYWERRRGRFPAIMDPDHGDPQGNSKKSGLGDGHRGDDRDDDQNDDQNDDQDNDHDDDHGDEHDDDHGDDHDNDRSDDHGDDRGNDHGEDRSDDHGEDHSDGDDDD